MTQQITLRSSIHSSMMKSMVWRSTVLAGAGALILVGAGAFMPFRLLSEWGLPIFLGGIILITCGMRPYRRLKQLEMNPYTLVIEEKWVHLSVKGNSLFSIPLEDIEKVQYVEKGRRYGIGLDFKRPLPQKIIVHANKPLNGNFKQKGSDLFLPYFSKRSCETLQECVETY